MPEGRYVTAWDEFHILPGVPEAIRRLNQAGFRVVVISNQRGVALGLYTAADVVAIHAAFQDVLQSHGAHVDAFYFCPHDQLGCNCRKPRTGLFDQAAASFPAIRASTSAMVGDSLSDIEFGDQLGMLTIFIDGNPEHQKPGVEAAAKLADMRFPSLSEAVEALLTSRAAANQAI